jgi:hypothetical protein
MSGTLTATLCLHPYSHYSRSKMTSELKDPPVATFVKASSSDLGEMFNVRG